MFHTVPSQTGVEWLVGGLTGAFAPAETVSVVAHGRGVMDDESETGDATDERFLRRALELARAAAADGNTPFGSLLVHDGRVVRESTNTTVTDDDVTAHPELKLARWAARELTPAERRATTMYTSTYPCLMCSGAFAYAGLGRLVYSVDGETAAALAPDGRNENPPTSDHLREREGVTVAGPVLEAEGRAVHRACWPR